MVNCLIISKEAPFGAGQDILKLLDTYKGLASVTLNDCRTCLMWTDLWDARGPCHSFPELFSFSKRKSVCIQLAKQMENHLDHFHLPLSRQAFDQLILLLEALENNVNSTDIDICGYIWGTPHFSSSKAYKHLRGIAAVHPCHSWLWK